MVRIAAGAVRHQQHVGIAAARQFDGFGRVGHHELGRARHDRFHSD